MDLKVKAIIRAAHEQHPEFGERELAHHILNTTPRDELAQFLREHLVTAVRAVVNSQTRNQRPRGGHTPTTNPTPAPSPSSGPRPSPKLEERRTWWRNTITARIHIHDGIHKTLADCTLDDLRAAVKDRDAAIGRIEEQMANFRHLIGLMVQHGAYTVAQLPAQQPWKRPGR